MPIRPTAKTFPSPFTGKALLALFLLIMLFVKLRLFDFGEYTSDLFSHLQMSQSWLEGKHLLYENCFGEHSLIHNYYFTPLLGLFTIWAGAYGLFIAHTLIQFTALTLLWGALCRIYLYRKERLSLLLLMICLFFGPVAFYIWDNPEYGWHAEMLYLPLSLFFTYALFQGRKWLIYLSALLLILVKEDGAVIGACLSLAWLWTGFTYHEKDNKSNAWMTYAKALAFWLVVFFLGLLLISYKNNFTTSRVGFALEQLPKMHAGDWGTYFYPMLNATFLLLLPLWLYTGLTFGLRPLMACIFLTLPLIVVEMVASLVYYPELQHGLTWVPRFSLFWALGACFICMQWLQRPAKKLFSPRHYFYLLLCLILQYRLLLHVTDYSAPGRFVSAFEKEQFPRGDRKEVLFMRQLGKKIPKRWQVAPRFFYFYLFPYQTIYWLDHPKAFEKIYPDLIISDWHEDPDLHLYVYNNYRIYYYGKLIIKVKPEDDALWRKLVRVSRK